MSLGGLIGVRLGAFFGFAIFSAFGRGPSNGGSSGDGKRQPCVVTSMASLPNERTQGGRFSKPTSRTPIWNGRSNAAGVDTFDLRSSGTLCVAGSFISIPSGIFESDLRSRRASEPILQSDQSAYSPLRIACQSVDWRIKLAGDSHGCSPGSRLAHGDAGRGEGTGIAMPAHPRE